MTSRPTDHANRNLAELHRRVVRRTSGGQVIWQPRIGCWITDKRFAGEPLPPPFDNLSYPDMFRELHCSARIYEFNACFKRIEDARVRVRRETLNEVDTMTVIDTPVGKQTPVHRRTSSSHARIQVRREIESEEEMRVALWRTEHTTWAWDQATYDRLLAEWGDLGLPTMYMPRVTIQDLFINTMGVEKAIYALHDYPDTVHAYFRALDECHDRMIDVINESPLEIVNFGDNLHGGTLPPGLFCRYVLPSYQHRCERLHAAGKFVHAHWDGDTKPLLPLAQETGLDGLEAVTPVPQGDVTLADIKAGLGDRMFLLDGLPAVYFDETFTEDRLIECTNRLLDLFAPKLILGISDEISSTGDLERIRTVGRIVDDYNAAKGTAHATAEHSVPPLS